MGLDYTTWLSKDCFIRNHKGLIINPPELFKFMSEVPGYCCQLRFFHGKKAWLDMRDEII